MPVKHGHIDSVHGKNGHSHALELRALSRRRLLTAFYINVSFLTVEAIGGIIANSLALLADAGHMLTDVVALLLAIFVSRLAERASTPTRTYGLLRAEVLGAFFNGAALVVIVGVIFWQAWRRLGEAPEINGPLMLLVAVFGLLANLGGAWALYGSRKETVNVRAAFLHMSADALGSAGAIAAGVTIIFTNWTLIDPIVSFIIGAVILWSAWGLLMETVNILLEATPKDIDYNEVKNALEEIEHIKAVTDLHIWTIASGIPSLSAHIRLHPVCCGAMHWGICLKEAQDLLRERFGIHHSTIQFEPEDFICEHPTM